MTLDEYTVDFDMKFSHTFTVKAKNRTDAKKKAFKKFNPIRNKVFQYNAWIDKL